MLARHYSITTPTKNQRFDIWANVVNGSMEQLNSITSVNQHIAFPRKSVQHFVFNTAKKNIDKFRRFLIKIIKMLRCFWSNVEFELFIKHITILL